MIFNRLFKSYLLKKTQISIGKLAEISFVKDCLIQKKGGRGLLFFFATIDDLKMLYMEFKNPG